MAYIALSNALLDRNKLLIKAIKSDISHFDSFEIVFTSAIETVNRCAKDVFSIISNTFFLLYNFARYIIEQKKISKIVNDKYSKENLRDIVDTLYPVDYIQLARKVAAKYNREHNIYSCVHKKHKSVDDSCLLETGYDLIFEDPYIAKEELVFLLNKRAEKLLS